MLKSVLFSAGVGVVVLSATSFAGTSDLKLTKDQCATLWSQALGSSTGDLEMDKATPYVADFKKADKNGDAKLSSGEWIDACDQGWVRTSTDAGSSAGAGATSDRTPAGATERTPGASDTGAAGTEAGKTPAGTSDRTPSK